MSAQDTHFLSNRGHDASHARDSDRDTMIVATETGILHRMEQESRAGPSFPRTGAAVWSCMKMITLSNLRDSLRDMKHVVDVPPAVADRARVPIERMVKSGGDVDP